MHIIRAIAGVIIGYVVVAVIAVMSLFATYQLGGTEFAFKTDSWEASTPWAVLSVLSGSVAAVIGGIVCYFVSGKKQIVYLLAGIVFAAGIILSTISLMKEPSTTPRPAEMTFAEAGNDAVSPEWVHYTMPFVGAIGILIGGSLVGRRSEEDD